MFNSKQQGGPLEDVEKNQDEWWRLVISLAELHQWELENHPLLETLTGRHLYYRLAQESVKNEHVLTRALKDVFGGMHFTEKALRTIVQCSGEKVLRQ